MATDVEIASRALVSLGASSVTALPGTTTEGVLANQFFLPTLDYLLALHRWNFAWKVADLVEDVPAGETSPGPYDDPIYSDWPYAYEKPVDLVKIEKLMVNGFAIGWEEKGSQIAADHPPTVEIEYIFRPTITTLPAYFLVPLEHLLASRLAVPITQRRALMAAYRSEFEDSFRRARHVDSVQSTAERLPLGNRLRAVRGA